METKSRRTIVDVLNIETGENIKADEFFSKSLEEITIYRSELQKAIEGFRDPLFVCYFCKQKVRIRGGISRTKRKKVDIFHFAHLKDSRECHIKTNNKFSKEEVNRIKYNGEKESLLHQTLKSQIANFLEINEKTKGEISSVQVEKIIKDKVVSEWKKPDINAFFHDNRMAIELQLSTTWLDVITKRQQFYKQQGIFIFWVFHVFDINDDIRKLTYNDVVFTNNQNAFVFNNETLELSKIENDLVLKCYYKEYSREGIDMEECWNYTFVTLSQLTFNHKEHCIYFHDSKQQKKDVQTQIDEQITKNQEQLRLKRINEEKLKKKIFELEYKLEYFNNKIESINHSVNLLFDKKNELVISHNKHFKFKEQIEEYTLKTIEYFSKEFSYTKPFYDYDTLLKDLEAKYGNETKQIVQTKNLKELEIKDLKKKLTAIANLNQIEIAGKKYYSLNQKAHWEFIKSNYKKIKIIDKENVLSLFASSELKSIPSESGLIRLQFAENKLFLIDFSTRIDDYKNKIQENKEIIEKQEKLLIEIKKGIEDLISNTLQIEIDSISLKKDEIELQLEKLKSKEKKVLKKITKTKEKITTANKELR